MVMAKIADPAAMQQIRARVATSAGLQPPPWVLEARVAERMEKLGLLDAQVYAETLMGRAEFACLVELLRVGETSFFRHQSQLKAVEDIVIPDLLKQRGALRMWSAGCATGEEPYTLAMLLRKSLPAHRKFSILASDISAECLSLARAGIYASKALDSVPPPHRGAFDRLNEKSIQVTARIRETVEFEERNLASGSYPVGFDLVFCRNVLIYFSHEAKQATLRRLVLSLREGGYLFLGYSESLRDTERLEVVKVLGSTAYRRSAQPSQAVPAGAMLTSSAAPSPGSVAAQPANASPTAEPSQSRTDTGAQLSRTLRLHGQYPDAIRLSSELRCALEQPGLRSLHVDLDGADFLGEETVTVLRRMQASARAMKIELHWSANRAGHLRFLRRHALLRPSGEGEP